MAKRIDAPDRSELTTFDSTYYILVDKETNTTKKFLLNNLSPAAGSTDLVTTGTVTTGTWNGTAIADEYIVSAGTWNGKLDDAPSDGNQYARNNAAWEIIESSPWTIETTGIKYGSKVAIGGSVQATSTLSLNNGANMWDLQVAGDSYFKGFVGIGTNPGNITRMSVVNANGTSIYTSNNSSVYATIEFKNSGSSDLLRGSNLTTQVFKVDNAGNVIANNIGTISSKDFWTGTQAEYDANTVKDGIAAQSADIATIVG